MPELPEVEVTRRRLAPHVLGRKIASVSTTRPSYFFLSAPSLLRRRLRGRTMLELRRHGKYLLAELDDGSSLLLHLGMTGQLFTRDARSPRLLRSTGKGTLLPEEQVSFKPDRHTHLWLRFDDAGPDLMFRDVRKFGKVRWLSEGQGDARLDKLGPDALTVTKEQLWSNGKRRKTPVKTMLLDQSVVAGVGNIYADEALFHAGVRPRRAANRVSCSAYGGIVSALRKVLLRSIETGGSSISDYILPDGSDGAFQSEHKVYGRTGEPCHVCSSPIRRIVLAQRSAHFCRRCQR